ISISPSVPTPPATPLPPPSSPTRRSSDLNKLRHIRNHDRACAHNTPPADTYPFANGCSDTNMRAVANLNRYGQTGSSCYMDVIADNPIVLDNCSGFNMHFYCYTIIRFSLLTGHYT